MDTEEAIMLALESGCEIRERIVMDKVAARLGRRRRRRTVTAAVTLFAAAVVTIAVFAYVGQGSASTKDQADGCGSLAGALRHAHDKSQAIVIARGELTSQRKTVEQVPYALMKLTQVRSLNGIHTRQAMQVWIEYSRYAAPTAADAPGLWGPDGELVGFITPSAISHVNIGPLLRSAPVADGRVILNYAACWDDPSITGGYAYTGPLREVPGSGAYNAANRDGEFRAVPLQAIQRTIGASSRD